MCVLVPACLQMIMKLSEQFLDMSTRVEARLTLLETRMRVVEQAVAGNDGAL